MVKIGGGVINPTVVPITRILPPYGQMGSEVTTSRWGAESWNMTYIFKVFSRDLGGG